jgi:hypothetical protein
MHPVSKESLASLMAVHVVDFPSAVGAARWAAGAGRRLRAQSGVAFARAMPTIGSAPTGGFGVGRPALRRVVLLTAWRDHVTMDAFVADAPLPQTMWWFTAAVRATGGTHRAHAPLVAAADVVTAGDRDVLAFAALTLGRSRVSAVPAFLRDGARIGHELPAAPGLITAISAGLPTTGNCTVSLWRNERSMVDFVYGAGGAHRATTARRPPILREQMRARLDVLAIGGDVTRAPLHPDRLGRAR